MTIRSLPPAPSRDRPNEFSGEMDAFLASMQGFADDANALEQSLQLVATTGTSVSTLTVGVGSKSLTTAPGKAWTAGAWVYIFAAAAVSNYMVGRVTSYDTETGALVVNVSAIDGSGSHSSWIIGLATPVADGHLLARDGSRAMTGELELSANALNALGAVPKQQAESISALAAAGVYRPHLASVGASVASNALTLTLDAERLEFRASTLTDGASVSRSASAASLTVPSGATLGTTSGVAARIAWGWIDNAGTPEPFVANVGGGLNLDETTLISTTAISGSANSASTFYSQNARTNVAFRVRGWCDITEATAGNWATAPTKVQGVGGLGVSAGGLGDVRTWQAVTRAGGTTYFNTTGRPIQLLLNGATSGANVVGIFYVSINGGDNLPIATAGGSGIPQTTLSGTITIPAYASYVVTYNNIAGGPSAYELR